MPIRAAAASLRSAELWTRRRGPVLGGGATTGFVAGSHASLLEGVRTAEAAPPLGSWRSLYTFGQGRINRISQQRKLNAPRHVPQRFTSDITSDINNCKVSQLEMELRLERSMSQHQMECQARADAMQNQFDKKVEALTASQNECKGKIGDVDTKVMLLEQRFSTYKDLLHEKMHNMRFNMAKSAGGVVTMMVGSVVAFFRISDKLDLGTTIAKPVNGNHPCTDFMAKDWFE